MKYQFKNLKGAEFREASPESDDIDLLYKGISILMNPQLADNLFKVKSSGRAKAIALSFLLFLIVGAFTKVIGQTTRTWDRGAGTNNWGDANNWSPNGVPASIDPVILGSNYAVNVNVNASCASITFNNTTSTTTLTVNSGISLQVTNAVTLNSSTSSNTSCSITGSGTLSCGSVVVGTSQSFTSSASTTMTSTISNFNINGNLSINSNYNNWIVNRYNNGSFLQNSGTVTVSGSVTTANEISGNTSTLTLGDTSPSLILGGATPFSLSGTGTNSITLNGTGATVNYSYTGNQTVRTYIYTNLTLSGSGTKTFSANTTITNNFSIATGVVADLGNSLIHSGTYLYFSGLLQSRGSWGGTGSGADNINTTYFAAGTGILNLLPVTYYSRQTGNWNDNTTWSRTSGGTAVGPGIYPVAGDAVTIESGYNVTLTANATCASITFTTITATSLTLGTYLLEVSGSITLPKSGSGYNQIIVGAGTLNASSIAFTNGGGTNRHQITISTGTVTVSGNITTDNTGASASIIFSGSGVLNLGGSLFSNGGGTFTPSTGTLNCNGTAQTINPFTFYNLTLSGSGTKTFSTSPTVNGVLSLEQTASATVTNGVITYGSTATLQYNKPAAYNATSEEWITPFIATGGIIIKNTGTITLSLARTLGDASHTSSLYLNGGVLAAGNNLTIASVGGGLASTINRSEGSMTGSLQGTGIYDVNYSGGSKTTGSELSGSGLRNITVTLTTNQTTLTLDQIRTPDGNFIINTGTFDSQTYTMTRTTAGGNFNMAANTFLLLGGLNNFPASFTNNNLDVTSTVNYYRSDVQTVNGGITYGNMTLSGSSAKTFPTGTTTVNGTLSMEGTATVILPGTLAYGASAILQYKGTDLQTTGPEFPASFTAGQLSAIRIENASTQGVRLNAAKDIGSRTFTIGSITPGSKFSDAGFQLTATGTLNLTSGSYTVTYSSFPGFGIPNIANGTTVDYAAAGTQTIKGLTYSNLTISGAGTNSKTADNDITVNGILTLTSANASATQGCLHMGSHTLNMGADATTAGTGDVTGSVRRSSFSAGTYYSFGNQFTTLNLSSGAAMPSWISVRLVLSNLGFPGHNTINRYYDILQSGGNSSTLVTLNLHYLEGEIVAPATEGDLNVFEEQVGSPGSMIDHGRSNSNFTDNWIGLANLSLTYLASGTADTKYWTLGKTELSGFTWLGVTTDWNSTSNWSGGVVPVSTSDVIIPNTGSISQPSLPAGAPLANVNSITIESGGVINGGTGTTLTVYGATGAWNCYGTFNAGTSTVIFTNAAATMSGTTDFNNVTVADGASLTLGTGNIMRIAGTLSLSATGVLIAADNINTVEYNGGAQTVTFPNGPTTGYHSLILSGSGAKTMPSSAMGIHGDFAMSGSSSATAMNQLTITGNVTLGAGTTFEPSTYTHTVSGNWADNGATFTPGTSTFIFNNATSPQAINGNAAALTFYNLVVNKGSQTLSVDGNTTSLTVNDFTETGGNFSAPPAFTVNGNATLTSGTFTAGANTSILGNWTNNGATFSNGNGTVIFEGASSQGIGGTTSNTFNNLTISKTSSGTGVSSAVDQTVNGVLNLNSPNHSDVTGALDMGSNTLIMGAVSTTTGTGDVTGYVRRSHTFSTNKSYTFGNQFNKLSFLDGGTLPSVVTFKISIGSEPGWMPNASDPTIIAIRREYEIVRTGGLNSNANLTLHYLNSELNGNSEERLTQWRWISGTPPVTEDMRRSNYNAIDDWVENIGMPISIFASDFGQVKISLAVTIAPNYTWNGSVSNEWNNGDNWTPVGPPLATSFVDIPVSGPDHFDPVLPNGGVTLGSLQILIGGILFSNDQPLIIGGKTAAWICNGDFVAGNGSVTFTGNGATIGGITQFNNIVINTGAVVSNSNGSLIMIGGTMTNNGTWYPVVGNEASTVDYNGGDQAVVVPNQANYSYNTLILRGTGTKTMPGQRLNVKGDLTIDGDASVTANEVLAVSKNLTIGANATFNASSFSHSVGGNWDNGGTFTAGTSTFDFNGTGAQTISGSNTFYNLTVSNTKGVTLNADLNISGTTLNLQAANPSATKGSLDMGTYTLDMGATATNTGIGDVTGYVRRTSFSPATLYTFGNPYNSVSLQTGTILPTSMTWKISTGTAPAWKLNAIKREYEIIQAGGSDYTANILMHYLDPELNGNLENELVKFIWTSSSVTEVTTSNSNSTQNWIENDGVAINSLPAGFGTQKISMAKTALPVYIWTGGAGDSDWNKPLNWNGGVPGTTSNVVIPNATSTGLISPTLPSGGVTIQSLTIQNGGVVNSNSEPLTINGTSGAWISYDATFNAGSGTVTFTNSGATIAGKTTFNNITIATGATLTNLQNADIIVTGAVTRTGTWSAAADVNTVEYTGTSQSVVFPDGSPSGYYNLSLGGSGTKTLPASDMNILGNLTLSRVSGTVAVAPSHSLTIGGNLTLGSSTSFTAGSLTHTISGNFTNNGTFTGTGSTIILNGTGAQTISGNAGFTNLVLSGGGVKTLSTGTAVDGDLTLSGTASTTTVANLAIGGNLNIGAGTAFTIAAANLVTVTSDITNNGGSTGLVIRSDAAGDGKLINNSSSVPATVELYLTGGLVSAGVGRFHYFVSPVQSMDIGTIPSVAEAKEALGITYFNGDLLRYREPFSVATKEQGWQYFHNYPGTPPGFTSLVSSYGYNIYLNGTDDILKFRGNLNAGQHSFSLSLTPGNTGAGWNLIGNPYPCNYDLNGVAGLATSEPGMANTVYYNCNGGYAYWNVLTKTGTTGYSDIVPPMTGFFVKVYPGGPSSLVLPAESKTDMGSDLRSAHKGTYIPTSKGLTIQKVKLVLTSGDKSDETIALLFDDATTSFNEHYDAYKLLNTKSASPEIYIELNGTDYFMKAVAGPTTTAVTLPLKIVIREGGTQTIKITEFENLDDISVVLKHGDIRTKLSQDALYTFSADAGTLTDFSLIFGDSDVSTDVENPADAKFRSWYNNNYLYLSFTGDIKSNTGRLAIYDLSGRKVLDDPDLAIVPGQIMQVPVILRKGLYVTDITVNNVRYKSRIVVY
jgi:hypothetical protein